ncbi:MAG: hypothetical protein B7X40_07225, partial [Cellulomonas sp. 14-74-6]
MRQPESAVYRPVCWAISGRYTEPKWTPLDEPMVGTKASSIRPRCARSRGRTGTGPAARTCPSTGLSGTTVRIHSPSSPHAAATPKAPSRARGRPSCGDGRPTGNHQHVRIVVRMSTFTDRLRARTDDELVTLLRLRPDLGSPSPATLASLAVRATSRMSLERALAAVDAAVLQALEAVVALAAQEPPTRDQVLAAVAGPAEAAADRALVGRALDDAVARALVWADDSGRLHPSPGLAEVLGPYPAGLAAPTATSTRPGVPPPPADVHALLAEAPAGARAVLEALAWGPPIGIAPEPSTAAGRTVAWLVRRGALRATDARHVVLPRPVALALRGGRTHPEVAREPMPSVGRRWPASLVGAESATAAERTVRLVGALVDGWGRTPPAVLRAGGL